MIQQQAKSPAKTYYTCVIEVAWQLINTQPDKQKKNIIDFPLKISPESLERTSQYYKVSEREHTKSYNHIVAQSEAR